MTTVIRRPTAAVAALTILGASVIAAVLPATPAYAVEYYARPSNGVFNVEGHGWGHGRGMSQWGAFGAAKSGLSADQITSFYYRNTAKGSIGNPGMRVWLQEDDGRDLQVGPASGLTARDLATGAGLVLPTGTQYKRWRFVVDSAGLHLEWWGGTAWSSPVAISGHTSFAGPMRFSSSASYLRLYFPDGSSRDYRGVLNGVKTGSSSMLSVDQLYMQDYLKGVVPREMPASWATACTNCPAALQSQAIAARSYSEYDREHASSSAAYDICDTTSCQVFGGSNYYDSAGNKTVLEDTNANNAVAATNGVVRTYGGQSIFAEFSSSNGGWSVAGSQPYLVAQQDPYDGVVSNNVHYWTAQLPASALEHRYPQVGHLTLIKVLCRDGNGQWGGRVLDSDCPNTSHLAVELDGVTSTGSPTVTYVTGSDVYNAYSWPSNGTGLKSRWWHIYATPPSAPQSPSVTAGTEDATVKWATPASDGGSPITDYIVSASPNGPSVKVSASTRAATLWGLTNGTTYTFTVVAQNKYGSSPAGNAGSATPNWYYGDFHPVTPVRILDTRTSHSPLAPNSTYSFTIAGKGGVPSSGVGGVALSVTVTNQKAAGYLAVYPYGAPRPATSNLNWVAGRTVVNAAMMRMGANYAVSFANISSGSVDLIVDVVGYVSTTSGDRLSAAADARVADTRNGMGVRQGPLLGGQTLTVPVAPPAGTTAAVLNVTGVGPTKQTYLTVWAHGAARPPTPNISLAPGETRAITVTTALGGGAVDIFNGYGSVQVIVDVEGWYAAPTSGTAGTFAPTLPRRVTDSRVGNNALGAGQSATFTVTGQHGVPAAVRAVVLNVTLINPSSSTHLSVYTSGTPVPATSTVNAAAGSVVPNMVVVTPSSTGQVSIFNAAGTANYTVDILGWYPST